MAIYQLSLNYAKTQLGIIQNLYCLWNYHKLKCYQIWLPDFEFRKKSILVFSKWIWQICQILLKCLLFTLSTQNWAQNVLSKHLKYSRMKYNFKFGKLCKFASSVWNWKKLKCCSCATSQLLQKHLTAFLSEGLKLIFDRLLAMDSACFLRKWSHEEATVLKWREKEKLPGNQLY